MLSILLKLFLGALIGGIGGFIYYKIVGCPTGACPITRKPLNSIIYGAFIGLLVAIS
jgi:hypothetical protein